MAHIPVLQKEVLYYLNPRANENFIDATFGEGGHSTAILKQNKPKGRILGFEWDPILYKEIKQRAKKQKRIIHINDSYTNLKGAIQKYNFSSVSGILFDLGLSSWHLENSGRGFSYLRDEQLDMRFNPQVNPLTAQAIINFWPFQELEKILREYGEEKFSKRISQKIIEARKRMQIETTFQFLEIIGKAIPGTNPSFKKPHFGARIFQALRIAVNDELENLQRVLLQSLQILEPKGRLVLISFHSLEDRICKNFMKQKAKEGRLKILTKKPVRPSIEEIWANPRSRSAKLRAAIKII